MGGQLTVEYHRLRAAAELERAAEAGNAKVAALHRELAELHRLSAGDGEDLKETSRTLAPAELGSAASQAG